MKVVLLGLCMLFVVVLFLQWKDWPDPLPEAGEEPSPSSLEDMPSADSLSTSGLDAISLRPEDNYVTVLERPLFLPERRPLPEELVLETANDQSAEAADVARLDVNATLIISPSEASVWLQDPDHKELVRLRLGDEYEGWTVAEINPDQILMERQGVTETLTVFDFSAQKVSPDRPRLPFSRGSDRSSQPGRLPRPAATSSGGR